MLGLNEIFTECQDCCDVMINIICSCVSISFLFSFSSFAIHSALLFSTNQSAYCWLLVSEQYNTVIRKTSPGDFKLDVLEIGPGF